MVFQAILRATPSFHLAPFSGRGRHTPNAALFAFSLSNSPPVFPRATRKSQIQSPFSFLPRQSHTTVAIWVAPNQLVKKKRPSDSHAGWRGGSWRGPRSLRGSCVRASRNLALGVPLPSARVRQRRCQERPRGRAESAGGPVFSCCSAPAGRRKPVLLSSAPDKGTGKTERSPFQKTSPSWSLSLGSPGCSLPYVPRLCASRLSFSPPGRAGCPPPRRRHRKLRP